MRRRPARHGRRSSAPGSAGDTYTCAEVQGLAVDHMAVLRRKTKDLRRLQRVLAEMAAQCTGDQIPELSHH